MKDPVRFTSTFITGFAELIPTALRQALAPKNCEIEHILDGLTVYSTDAAIKDVVTLPFFNNTFLHMVDFPTSYDIKQILNELNTTYNFHFGLKIRLPKNVRSFRLVISHENKTINPHPQYKSRVEAKIAKDLKLRIDPKKPDTEFWLVTRSEGYAFLGMRLTKHPDYTTSLPKGALRPELAYLITSLVPVQENGTILDPFAGSGSIVEACAKSGWKRIIASDFVRDTVQRLKGRVRKFRNIKVTQQDGLELSEITDSSVDAIITNPPWGNHFAIDVTIFYPKFFSAAHRVLKEGGYLVILVENTRETHQVMKQIKGFTIENSFNTLVSGRKAQIYLLHKTT